MSARCASTAYSTCRWPNPDGKLAGIVSDRELRRPDWVDQARDLAHVYYLDDDMLVREVMIGQVHVVHSDDTLRACWSNITSARCR